MRRKASMSLASGLLFMFCFGCSDMPKTPATRGRGAIETSGRAGNGPGTAAKADTASQGPEDLSNPAVLTTPPSAGMGGGGASGSNTTPTDCQIGKFCPPSEPDPDNCGTLDLRTDLKTVLKPGNVLVVFDRSTSMEADWGGAPKYQAAGNALIAAITPLRDQLTVGGVFFPSQPEAGAMTDNPCPAGCNVADPLHWIPGPGACCLNIVTTIGACDVNTIDKPDEINWSKAGDFIMNLPNQWHFNGVAQTPLGLAVQRAAAAISAKMFTDPLVVIIMTDGEPNCDTDPQAVITQVTTWNKAGIPTYVVGLPGAQMAADLLNQVANAGGSGMYINPMDPVELQDKLKAVITSTVRAGFESCTFKLDPAASVPAKLHLIIKQNGMDADIPRNWSARAHWKVSSDGTQVELEDQLCDMAKNGELEGLRFVFGCVEVPPPPPPPPLN